jgi:hypothetical protein
MEALDDLQDTIDEIQDTANKLNDMDGEEIPFGYGFSQSFMQKNTDVDDIEEFIENSPWDVETLGDLTDIPETELDRYVDDHSRFKTWEQMSAETGGEAQKRRLSLNH